MEDGFITTPDGVRLYFQKLGAGAQTVLVPNGICYVDELARFAAQRTLLFFDLRNRGRSDTVADEARLERGVLNDVDDVDAVRRHAGADRVDLIGHSYVGATVVLYAKTHPAHVNRVVQIGPLQPFHGRQYPPHLTCVDETFRRVMAGLAGLERDRATTDPVEFCRRVWAVLDPLYVTDPADVHKLPPCHRCELPNERNLMKYLRGTIMPSLQRLDLKPGDFAEVSAPVLTIHGTHDRSAPYGGGREWAVELPNARLLSIEGGGHAPWIESPQHVWTSIETFLTGAWPTGAAVVESV
jgi:pimeloyl-ACP methyl ester carboxylesterase